MVTGIIKKSPITARSKWNDGFSRLSFPISKKKGILLLSSFFLLLQGLQKLAAQDSPDSIVIITSRSSLPVNAIYQGKAEVHLSSKSNAYEDIIQKLNQKADRKDANLLWIHRFYSTIFGNHLEVNIRYKSYRVASPDSVRNAIAAAADSISGRNDGFLFLYRPAVSEGLGSKKQIFDALLNEGQRFSMFQGSFYPVRLSPGKHRIRADVKNGTFVDLDVAPGHSYFIRCDVTKPVGGANGGQIVITFGGWIHRVLQIPDEKIGRMEFEVTRDNAQEEEGTEGNK